MDKVLLVVLYAVGDLKLSSRIEEELDICPRDKKAWLSWLAGSNWFYGTNGTNTHWAWELIVRITYQHTDAATPPQKYLQREPHREEGSARVDGCSAARY